MQPLSHADKLFILYAQEWKHFEDAGLMGEIEETSKQLFDVANEKLTCFYHFYQAEAAKAKKEPVKPIITKVKPI